MRPLWLALAGCVGSPSGDAPDTDDPADTELAETDAVETDETDVAVTSPCRGAAAVLTVTLAYEAGEPVPLAAEEDVPVERGNPSQGFAFHLPVAVALDHVDELVHLSYRVVDETLGTSLFADDWLTYAVALVPEAGIGHPWACHGRYPPVKVPVDPGRLGAEEPTDGTLLCGRAARVEVEARDVVHALLADASVAVRLQPPLGEAGICD